MPDPELTVYQAKLNVLAEERRLVSAIPAQFVAGHEQNDKAHLITCTGGGYRWPDKGRVKLKGGPDVHEILLGIAKFYEAESGFSVEWDNTLDGAELLTITAQSGASYLVAPRYSNSELQIATFSECFQLGPDQWSGDAF